MTEQSVNQARLDSTSLSDLDGVGPTLRRLREAKRITPADVSMRLKFSKRQLDALENEQWHLLPQGMSLRGFVRNYARYLEADVDALLTMLDNQVGPPQSAFVTAERTPPLGHNADLNSGDDVARRPWGWLLIILIFILVAGFYAINRGWVPDSWLVFDWLKSLKT